MRTETRILLVASVLSAVSLFSCKSLPGYGDDAVESCEDRSDPSRCPHPVDGFTFDDGVVMTCTRSPECGDATPICESGSCRPCIGPADDGACASRNPATPRCGASHRCAACATNADCGGATPVCDGGTCRRCTASAECPTDLCEASGACVPQAEVTYVDFAPQGSVADCTMNGGPRDGTKSKPFCDIKDALAVTTNRFVVVGGHAAGGHYGRFSITSTTPSRGSLLIHGMGATSPTTSSIAGDVANPGVQVLISSGDADVTIEGMVVGDAKLPMNGVGVQCSNPGTGKVSLTLRRSLIQHSADVGISTSNCSVQLDANVVIANQGGGVAINMPAKATYAITNQVVVENGSDGPGVLLRGAGSGVFAFNTVAFNKTFSLTGGVDCDLNSAKPWRIDASIVWKNDGAQLTTNCDPHYVDESDMTMTPTDFSKDPLFLSMMGHDYRLQSGSPCKDVIDPGAADGGAAPTIDHDVGGTSRPKGSGWDIGAWEVIP